MIEAVVFDFDGLIVDTEALNFTVTREAYGQFNVVLSMEIWHQIFHQSSEFQHQTIEEHYGVKLNFDEIGNLRSHKFRAAFDCIRTKEDVLKKKPDPEVYLSVLDGLKISPQNAIAFEDAPIGAVAAKLAGMRCVIVPNYVTEKLVFAEDIDHRLTSMSDMNLEELIKQF